MSTVSFTGLLIICQAKGMPYVKHDVTSTCEHDRSPTVPR